MSVDLHLNSAPFYVEMFCCRIGEGRACWSLGNAHTALGNHDQAMHFAEKHLEICREVRARSFSLAASFVFRCFDVLSFETFTIQWLNQPPLFVLFLQTGDRSGELTARMNVSDLQMVLGLSYSTNSSTLSENKEVDYNRHGMLAQTCTRHF